MGGGGVGVVALGDTSIINEGVISGGLSADGSVRANAIELTGGGNLLELRATSVIVGNVVSVPTAASDTLVLGGDADGTFDATEIGSKYLGFSNYEKSGASTWSLTGGTTGVTPWVISDGALAVTSNAALGDVSGPLTLNGGFLRIDGNQMSTLDRNLILTASGGGLRISEADLQFTLGTSLAGSGEFWKSGSGTLVFTVPQSHTGTT